MTRNDGGSLLRRFADGFVYWFAELTAWPVILLLFRTKRRVEGGGRVTLAPGTIIAATHSSIWDPLILFFQFPWQHIHFLCSDVVMNRSPLFFRILTIMGCIPVSREHFEMGCVWEMVDILARGGIVCIFPEGSLSPDGEIKAYKSGVTMIALRANAPVLPVYIKPAVNIWERKAVAIGRELNVRELAGESPSLGDIERVTRLIHDKTAALKSLAD